jgi:hypothetical protein
MRLSLLLLAALVVFGAPRSAAAQNLQALEPDAMLTLGEVSVVGGNDPAAAQTLAGMLDGIGAQLARCLAAVPRPGEVTSERASRPVRASLRLRFDASGALVPAGVRVTGGGVARGAVACVVAALGAARAPAAGVTAATAALRVQRALMVEGPRVVGEAGSDPLPEAHLTTSVEPIDASADNPLIVAATRVLRTRVSAFRECLRRNSPLGAGLRATYVVRFGPNGAALGAEPERAAVPESASACLVSVLQRLRFAFSEQAPPDPVRLRLVLLYDVVAAAQQPAREESRHPREVRQSGATRPAR